MFPSVSDVIDHISKISVSGFILKVLKFLVVGSNEVTEDVLRSENQTIVYQ